MVSGTDFKNTSKLEQWERFITLMKYRLVYWCIGLKIKLIIDAPRFRIAFLNKHFVARKNCFETESEFSTFQYWFSPECFGWSLFSNEFRV